MRSKQIFPALKNLKLKTYQQQTYRSGQYFSINFVNIKGCLEILDLEFQNLWT